jgi:hypothetical protein
LLKPLQLISLIIIPKKAITNKNNITDNARITTNIFILGVKSEGVGGSGVGAGVFCCCVGCTVVGIVGGLLFGGAVNSGVGEFVAGG